MTAEQGSPTTEAGRELSANLAYDDDPAHYLPGDYIARYRDAILAIEAEARQQALTDAIAAVEGLVVKHGGRCAVPDDPEDPICVTHSELLLNEEGCEDQPYTLLAVIDTLTRLRDGS